MKPSAVLFDFGETLLHIADYDTLPGDAYLYENAHNPRHVSFEEYREYRLRLHAAIEEKRNLANLEHSWRSFNAIVNVKFGLTSPNDAELELKYWTLINRHESAPGIVPVLDHLRGRGIPMGVVSNSLFSGAILKYELSLHGIGRYFQIILSSADLGIRKPDSEIFAVAASGLGVRSSEILFIGDSIRADYEGSRSAGMIPLLYRGLNAYETDGVCESIEKWQEFINALDD